MKKLNKIGYSLKDVAIIPAAISSISSRKQVNPFVTICGRNVFPIFVAPMADVTDENNYKTWINNGVVPVIPRTIRNENRNTIEDTLKIAEETFVSLSLNESIELLNSDINFETKKYICIDLANGHMIKLLTTCRQLKEKYDNNIEIMTGNIANPEIYTELCHSGIDWVRCCIGSGARCTTSPAIGIHYSSATLMDELNEQKKRYINDNPNKPYTKLIMDGGISWYDDAIKSLALGADAVMIGRIFAECEEACSPILYCVNEDAFNEDIGYTKEELENVQGSEKCRLKPYRNYRGMSHRSMQKITGGDGSKVSEGICRPVEVKYEVSHWLENMEAYLRSAMSYTSSETIEEFQKSEMIILGGSGSSVYKK